MRQRDRRAARPDAEGRAATHRRTTLKVGPGKGKFLIRIRLVHVTDRYAAMIAKKSIGAVKLDLLLRTIALLPDDAGARRPGYVLRDWGYEHLHDLVRGGPVSRTKRDLTDREVRHLKRKWVDNQVRKLVAARLLRVEPVPGKRPRLIVLRDDGRGGAFDDPGATGDDPYVTIRGSVVASGAFVAWGAPEVAAMLAALYAEFYAERPRGRPLSADGTGRWWRQLAWFNNPAWHPLGRPLLPFSKSLLERGFATLAEQQLITRTKVSHDPRTKKRLPTSRVVYRNGFARLDRDAGRVP